MGKWDERFPIRPELVSSARLRLAAETRGDGRPILTAGCC